MNHRCAVPALLVISSLLFSGCGEKSGMNSGDTAAPPSVSAGAEANPPKSSSAAPSFEKEIAAYRTYVIGQCDSLVKQTDLFVKAIKDGDLEQAKKLYAPTRMYYERIEPIAEALGDLDPNIDARENDVDGKDWRGFHRLEKGLWQENTTRGLETFADRLASDVKLLRAKVETVEIQPVLLVTGAVELLNEVSSSKVTGEEERYSHTDLYDFAANVEGANEIFRILEPELKKKDPDLAGQIGQRFADLNAALAPYKKGDGYVSYTELGAEQTRKLSQSLDALAEPLSQMGRLLGV